MDVSNCWLQSPSIMVSRSQCHSIMVPKYHSVTVIQCLSQCHSIMVSECAWYHSIMVSQYHIIVPQYHGVTVSVSIMTWYHCVILSLSWCHSITVHTVGRVLQHQGFTVSQCSVHMPEWGRHQLRPCYKQYVNTPQIYTCIFLVIIYTYIHFFIYSIHIQ